MRLILAYMLAMAAMAPAALGPEVVKNGDFFVDEIWEKGTGWTIVEGNALHVSTGFSRGSLVQSLPDLVAGATYEVRYTISDMTTVGLGYITVHLGGTEGGPFPVDYEVVETLVAGESGCIEFEPVMAAGSTCRIDNVSVRRIIESTMGGDFDNDGAVDIDDLTLFVADWLSAEPNTPGDLDDSGQVDYADFALFAADWGSNRDNTPPVATDQAVQVTVGDAVNITLAATDANHDYLTYKINQMPTLGTLTRLAGGLYRYRPYLESEGTDTVLWQCSDGKAASNEATVTITVLPEVLDNLRYDGRAVIEIEDGSNVNLDPNCVITCWFRTLWSAGTLLSKRDAAGGPGLVVTIEDGYPVVTLADQDGREHIYRLNYERVDDGQWWFLGIHLNDAAEENIIITCEGPVSSNKIAGAVEDTILGFDPNNTAPLVVGSYLNGMFYGAVDYLTNSAVAGDILTLGGALIEGRAGEVNMFSPNYYRRWLMDEGDGETITDAVGGVTGTLSNHNRIKWSTPEAALDSRGKQRDRLRGVDGNMMLPDFRKRN